MENEEWSEELTEFHGIDPRIDVEDQVHFERFTFAVQSTDCFNEKKEREKKTHEY